MWNDIRSNWIFLFLFPEKNWFVDTCAIGCLIICLGCKLELQLGICDHTKTFCRKICPWLLHACSLRGTSWGSAGLHFHTLCNLKILFSHGAVVLRSCSIFIFAILKLEPSNYSWDLHFYHLLGIPFNTMDADQSITVGS